MAQKLLTHEPESWPYRVAEWAEDHWLEVALGVNPLLLTVVSVVWSKDVASFIVPDAYVTTLRTLAVIVIVLLIGLQVCLIVANRKRSEKMSSLRKEIASLKAMRQLRALEAKPLILAYLKHLGEQELEFGTRLGEAERLTLYLHDDQKSAFVPLSRFSNSPEFCQIIRTEYPDDQGCLALAWKNGFHYKFDYPNPAKWDEYLRRSLKDGMPQEVIEKMRMKSISYCGVVIWNKQRTKQVGVLMLEATYDRYNLNQMAAFTKKHQQGYFGDLIDSLE